MLGEGSFDCSSGFLGTVVGDAVIDVVSHVSCTNVMVQGIDQPRVRAVNGCKCTAQECELV